jgi:hypothetical protein
MPCRAFAVGMFTLFSFPEPPGSLLRYLDTEADMT